MNLRWLVLKILDSIEFEGIFVHDAIKDQTEALELTKQERGFIKKVVFGVLENRIYLDYVINQFSKVKVRKMKPAIRHIMRLSVYQLLFMKNIPQSAVCNEAVKLVKKRKMHSLSGFVNGVLRNISRSLHDIQLPDKNKDAVQYLSVKYSFDAKMIERLLRDYSLDVIESFLSVSNEEAPLTIRVNEKKVDLDDLGSELKKLSIDMTSGRWLPYAAYLSGIDSLETMDTFKEGLFTVQDESSMLVGHIGVEPWMQQVLDVCAAPGGKTTHVAALIGDQGLVRSYDVSDKKIMLINENIQRLGLDNVLTKVQDAAVLDESLVMSADMVIADVPCSGLGIIRKKPDIKWHMDMDKINDLAEIQRSILENVQQYVKPGGVLMYSTCTIVPQENEENVRWFLDHHDTFTLELIEGPYAGEDGMVHLMPTSGMNDGFFIAKLRRKK